MQGEDEKPLAETRNVRIRDFFYHLVVYLFVLAILAVFTGLEAPLTYIALFWGFAVALHGVYAVFG